MELWWKLNGCTPHYAIWHTLHQKWIIRSSFDVYLYPQNWTTYSFWCPAVEWKVLMMTSSNENIFRVTGHLCGEFTGPGEFPTQRPVTRIFDVSLICVWINGWINNREAGDLRRYRAHSDVIVMCCGYSFCEPLPLRGMLLWGCHMSSICPWLFCVLWCNEKHNRMASICMEFRNNVWLYWDQRQCNRIYKNLSHVAPSVKCYSQFICISNGNDTDSKVDHIDINSINHNPLPAFLDCKSSIHTQLCISSVTITRSKNTYILYVCAEQISYLTVFEGFEIQYAWQGTQTCRLCFYSCGPICTSRLAHKHSLQSFIRRYTIFSIDSIYCTVVVGY